MLRISKAQIDTLSRSLTDSFVKRMVDHLRERFSKHVESLDLTPPGRLEALVRRGISEAASFGVVEEADVRLYIECMVYLNPHFAQEPRLPRITETLRRSDLSGTQKMDLLHNHIVFGELRRTLL